MPFATFPQRKIPLLPLAAAALISASFVCTTQTGLAQPYPAKPVRIIVPFPAGGGVDSIARLLAQRLFEDLRSSFIVENRVGGGGAIGTIATARAAPDGLTLLVSAPEFVINPAIRPNVGYDPLRDFTHISQLSSGQYMLVCHPSVPVKNVRELLALAKRHPSELFYGSSGVGGINHLAGELLQIRTGIRWTHVPFKGTAPAITATAGGEVAFAFGGTLSVVNLLDAGRLRAIAVTGTRRLAKFSNVPTIVESGVPGYEVTGWYGFYAPAGTSEEIVRRLHAATVQALNHPRMRENLEQSGNEPVASSPQQFAAFVHKEIEKWAPAIRAIRARSDKE